MVKILNYIQKALLALANCKLYHFIISFPNETVIVFCYKKNLLFKNLSIFSEAISYDQFSMDNQVLYKMTNLYFEDDPPFSTKP